MSRGKWRRNEEQASEGENMITKTSEEQQKIDKELRIQKEDADNRKKAQKDWDNAWYEIRNNKLIKRVRAKNGNEYSLYCFTIKTPEQKAKVKELQAEGKIK